VTEKPEALLRREEIADVSYGLAEQFWAEQFWFRLRLTKLRSFLVFDLEFLVSKPLHTLRTIALSAG